MVDFVQLMAMKSCFLPKPRLTSLALTTVADEFALAAVKIFEVVCNVSDPIILDTNQNGAFDITSINGRVNFAMTVNAPSTSWLDGDDFFDDANGNGVDDGTEMFGTTGPAAFTELSVFDTNADRASYLWMMASKICLFG